MQQILGKWPGVVKTYDAGKRTATVEVPGITDGSKELPEAVFCYDIGDRSLYADPKRQTEVEVLAGDLVWLEFEAGDPRFPIIVGYRTPRQGNSTGWRRWHHANIEMTAEGTMILNATDLVINTTTTTINGVTTVNGDTTVNGQIALNGDTAIQGSLTNNGTNVGSSHTHTEQGDGADVSAPH